MSRTDTKDRIIRHLRSTDEPALSARKLADQLDVSVRTINNHVDELESKERIATTQIGNATAYYIPFSDLPSHKKPNHTCIRCGREVNEGFDFAKLEDETYYERGNLEESSADFHILCRFCHSDFVSWVNNDSGFMGMYPGVHGWNIPTAQLLEVRDDTEITTAPGTSMLRGNNKILYEFIEAEEDGYEEGVPQEVVLDAGEEKGMARFEAERALNQLNNGGYLHEPTWEKYVTAK